MRVALHNHILYLVLIFGTPSYTYCGYHQGTPSYTRKQSEGAMEHFRYEVSFENITTQVTFQDIILLVEAILALFQEDEYTVTISTELNGRTVTQTVEKFPMGQPDPQNPT